MVACERDFAYKYLLRLREPGEIEESMDVSTFGNILHEALEHLFKNKLQRPLTVQDFDDALHALDTEIGRAIAQNYNPSLVEEGENRLLHRMIRATARKMLHSERREIAAGAQRTLISLEESISASFGGSGDFAEGIVLRGTADRLEREDGVLTVVDYKSGNVQEKDVVLRGADLGEALDAGTHPKALQLLVYSAIGLQNFQEQTARAAIRSGKNAYAGALAFQWQKRDCIEPAHVDEFIAWLDARLVTLQEKNSGLEHADSARFCAYCQTWQNPD
jgi:RecB family exonuclease